MQPSHQYVRGSTCGVVLLCQWCSACSGCRELSGPATHSSIPLSSCRHRQCPVFAYSCRLICDCCPMICGHQHNTAAGQVCILVSKLFASAIAVVKVMPAAFTVLLPAEELPGQLHAVGPLGSPPAPVLILAADSHCSACRGLPGPAACSRPRHGSQPGHLSCF